MSSLNFGEASVAVSSSIFPSSIFLSFSISCCLERRICCYPLCVSALPHGPALPYCIPGWFLHLSFSPLLHSRFDLLHTPPSPCSLLKLLHVFTPIILPHGLSFLLYNMTAVPLACDDIRDLILNSRGTCSIISTSGGIRHLSCCLSFLYNGCKENCVPQALPFCMEFSKEFQTRPCEKASRQNHGLCRCLALGPASLRPWEPSADRGHFLEGVIFGDRCQIQLTPTVQFTQEDKGT